MENIIIAAIIAAAIHAHVTNDEKHEVVEDPPKTVQWVIITDQ